jgi:hypothetical protein
MIWKEVGPMSELGRLPWRPEDLAALLPPIGAFDEWMAAYKAEHRDVRWLPVLSSRECRDYLARLVVLATTRPLSPAERFLHGQLVTRFEQAVSRETSLRPRVETIDPMEAEDVEATEKMPEGGKVGP